MIQFYSAQLLSLTLKIKSFFFIIYLIKISSVCYNKKRRRRKKLIFSLKNVILFLSKFTVFHFRLSLFFFPYKRKTIFKFSSWLFYIFIFNKLKSIIFQFDNELNFINKRYTLKCGNKIILYPPKVFIIFPVVNLFINKILFKTVWFFVFLFVQES